MTSLKAEVRIRLDDPGRVLAGICDALAEHEIEIARTADGVRAVLRGTIATARAEPGALVVAAEAADEAALVAAKMTLASYLVPLAGKAGAEIAWTGDGIVSRPPNFREMRVVRTATVTPHMRRITLSGQDLGRYATGGLHVKLLLPQPGAGQPEWPVLGANGLPVWPEGEARPAVRTYTLRRIDAAAGEVDIDVVLHDDGGPGSLWAGRAQPGDRIGMLGPGGGTVGEADWYLLAGDETALPAIGRILEQLPATARGHAFVEIADAGEEQPLAHPPGIRLTWLHRGAEAPGGTTLLADAVHGVDDWPGADVPVFAWAGTEFEAFRALRTHWRGDRGLDRTRHLAVAYWRRGRAEGEFDKREEG